MSEAPKTRGSLLIRLRQSEDRDAWEQFVDLYGPVIYGFARRQGLQDADAADVMQETLRAVAASLPGFEYDPARGSFRGWLFTTVRHRLRHWRRRQVREPAGSGDPAAHEALAQQPADDELEAHWERDYERQLFQQASRRVRPRVQESTWLAFWQTAVEGREVGEVAADLGLTVASVYLARSRVMARLRDEVERLREESS